jgi:hypothetical protein
MKKLVVLLGLIIGFNTNAQDFKIGLTLAPTISFNKNFEKDSNENWVATDNTGGLGWKGGLLADYNFARNYNIHSGLLIHSKNLSNDNYSQSLTTVEIPVALKLRSNEVADNVHITGFFGGTVDFNVSAKKKSGGVETQNIDNFNKIGMSFMAGVGGEYDLDFGSVGIGLSYHLGFTDIESSDQFKTLPKHLSIDFVFYF